MERSGREVVDHQSFLRQVGDYYIEGHTWKFRDGDESRRLYVMHSSSMYNMNTARLNAVECWDGKSKDDANKKYAELMEKYAKEDQKR